MNTIQSRRKKIIDGIVYSFLPWDEYDYDNLLNIPVKQISGRGRRGTYFDCVIMADTETSKKQPDRIAENHIVCWCMSLRTYRHNICTLYGRKPSDFIKCIDKIKETVQADFLYIYFHNLAYDYVFLRKFMFKGWGFPLRQLNTKPYYPINIEFENGVIFKDSLILAQRGLDKWSKDLDITHKKAVGSWDYDWTRDQDTELTREEMHYIEHDTLAGAECVEATMLMLGKRLHSMPYTATGIPREEARNRGKKNRAHDRFLSMALDYQGLKMGEAAFHGGFTHSNRHYLNQTIKGDIKSYDFASSYPFIMLTHKFPMERFTRIEGNYALDKILASADDYAFMFRFIVQDIRIKDDNVIMPTLQMSKCVKTINAVCDNGRVIAADYVNIILTEIDAKLIKEQYQWKKHACIEVMYAKKKYLPRWYRDYVYECFRDKTMLKGQDPVLYSIAKAKLNSLYGMCAQHPVKENIEEDYKTGEYSIAEGQDMESEYDKYVKRFGSFLPYQWGIWVTNNAMYNLFQLGKCCDTWLYSDTDSVYGMGWHEEEVETYNKWCIDILKDSGYDGIEHNGRKYYLGVAEHEPGIDDYTEFRVVGAKRYCYRQVQDGKLHITVAGVPKKGAEVLRTIDDFTDGLIFSGTRTGKKQHTYFFKDDIYTDDHGNECGDSIDLSECDYLLQSEKEINIDDIIYEDIGVINYDEA